MKGERENKAPAVVAAAVVSARGRGGSSAAAPNFTLWRLALEEPGRFVSRFVRLLRSAARQPAVAAMAVAAFVVVSFFFPVTSRDRCVVVGRRSLCEFTPEARSVRVDRRNDAFVTDSPLRRRRSLATRFFLAVGRSWFITRALTRLI
jgi:hypothetical protein